MSEDEQERSVDTGILMLRRAASAKKCHQCGCLHHAIPSIRAGFSGDNVYDALHDALVKAEAALVPERYDCLGCDECYPAVALSALGIEDVACPAGVAAPREGWPPLPGEYVTLRYIAPVAVCTLTSQDLSSRIAGSREPSIAIAGTMQTENLGIERVVTNINANPNIRFLILCGDDSRRAIGHLPGASFVALAKNGLDERLRIPDAPGRRPYIKNVEVDAVDYFRATVELIDMIGETDEARILDAARACSERDPGTAEPYERQNVITPVSVGSPPRLVLDPAGYFVIYPDAKRGLIMLEHYNNDGLLDSILEGETAAGLYCAAIDSAMLTKLDHAAYLGKELARAEYSLTYGVPYVQDAAPDRDTFLSCAGVCSGEGCGGK